MTPTLPFQHIDRIEILQALPRVFRDTRPESEIWLTDLALTRPGYYMVEAESGTGKSSLCAYLYGTRTDYLGSILFNGTDASSLSLMQWQEIRRRHIAYLPQELDLFPELSALENIRIKNDLTGYADEAQIHSWLERIGLGDRKDFPVGKMSIGQQQRVAIIRSICQPFDFILLDEPVSHLDFRNNRIAAEIIEAEAQRNDASIIATSVGNKLSISSSQLLKL